MSEKEIKNDSKKTFTKKNSSIFLGGKIIKSNSKKTSKKKNSGNFVVKKEIKSNSKKTFVPFDDDINKAHSDNEVCLYNLFSRPVFWEYPKDDRQAKIKFFGYSPQDLMMVSMTIKQKEIDLIRESFNKVGGIQLQEKYDAIRYLITCEIPSHLSDYIEKFEIKPSKLKAKDPDSGEYTIPIGLGLFAKKDLTDLDLGIVNYIPYFQ